MSGSVSVGVKRMPRLEWDRWPFEWWLPSEGVGLRRGLRGGDEGWGDYGVVVKRTNMVELTEVVVVNWLT